MHGSIVMEENWIQDHVNIYLKHIIIMSDEWNARLLRPALRLLQAFPDAYKKIDFSMIYDLYCKGYVKMVAGFHLDDKVHVKRSGSAY